MLLKFKTYKVPASIGLSSTHICPNIFEFDTSEGPNFVRADVLDRSWPCSIFQQNMPKIRSTYDTKLPVSGTIALHLRIGELRICVNFCKVDNLAVPVLSGTTFIDRYIKSDHPSERNTVPYHSPSVPILMIHGARSVAKKEEDSDILYSYIQD